MRKIKFTIQGNQDNPNGNPVPFQRAIKGMWRQASTRYMNWQAFVRTEYQRQMNFQGFPVIITDVRPDHHVKTKKKRKLSIKPIQIENSKIHMDIKIYWADKTHGDPDNVFKGIADALMVQDKYLVGSFDYEYSDDKKGSVDVEIFVEL